MKQLALIFIILSAFSVSLVKAQKDSIRDEFLDAEFFLVDEDYKEALQSYMKVFDAGNQENANINYRIGICYINMPGEKEKAIPHLEKAIKNVSASYREGVYKGVHAPIDAWLFLGNAYRINYQLDEAINAYQKYLELNKKGNPYDNLFAQQQISACNRAKQAINNPSTIKKENIGKKFNTTENNFNAVFSGNGNSMAFMTSQRFYNAIYFVRKLSNMWTNPINVTSQIESDGNQYVCSLSWDGTKMYLVRVSSFNGDIMESEFVSGMWTKAKPIDKVINSKYFESHASLSPDGNTLYFTSNRKESLGGMDIFMSVKTPGGKWGTPVNLGHNVNTEFNEENPFICEDGKTLFFSSQGHDGIGGFDIFYTIKQDDDSWSNPVPLPYPVNTTDDDLFYYPVENGKAGYQTQYLADGLGSGDIYFINLFPDIEVADISDDVTTTGKEVVIIDTEKDEPAETEVEALKEIAVKYSIKPIYFNFDSYTLSEENTETLDVIVAALKDYPNMVIEVRGHTDALGPFNYNQLLSEKRAKAVINYLVSKGAAPDNLHIKGLSMSEPVAINKKPDGTDSKEGRRYNRRVDFRILLNPIDSVNIESPQVPENLKQKK